MAAEKPGKAYYVRNDMDDEGRCALVYAPNEKKARAAAANTDEVGDYGYIELTATRAPVFDGLRGDEVERMKFQMGWWRECPGCSERVNDDRTPHAVLRGDEWFCGTRCALSAMRHERAKTRHEVIALERAKRLYPSGRLTVSGTHPEGHVHVIHRERWSSQTPDAACVLLERSGYVLAVSRKHNRADWGLPGGKLEPGESPLAAAARELREETGIRVEKYRLRMVHSGVTHTKKWTPTYALRSRTGEQVPVEAPLDMGEGAVGWVTWDELCSPRATYHEYNRELRRAVKGLVP